VNGSLRSKICPQIANPFHAIAFSNLIQSLAGGSQPGKDSRILQLFTALVCRRLMLTVHAYAKGPVLQTTKGAIYVL
jgi:hypothetical protein